MIAEQGIEKALAQLDGMFALAVFDRQKRCLTLARDPFGEKPLCYGFWRGVLLFGSELKALQAWPGFAPAQSVLGEAGGLRDPGCAQTAPDKDIEACQPCEEGGERALPTELTQAVPRPRLPDSAAATEPMPLRPLADLMRDLPSMHAPLADSPAPGAGRWQDYVDRCAAIKGSVGCCVFDLNSMLPLAHTGTTPSPDRLTRQGVAMLSSMADATRALGLGNARPEAAVSTATHHLLLRPVPGHPGVAVHLVLTAADANLTLARRQLERIEPPK